jgi:uncharacterized protein YjiS (DUF1127 family)
MADQTFHITDTDGAGRRLLNALRGLGLGVLRTFESIGTARTRMAEIERLHNMSDAELAAIGVKRDEIVQYVFRDTYYL